MLRRLSIAQFIPLLSLTGIAPNFVMVLEPALLTFVGQNCQGISPEFFYQSNWVFREAAGDFFWTWPNLSGTSTQSFALV